jgi:hypothetical protein
MPFAEFKGWPRELAFRQNTFSFAWIDAVLTIGMREATILDQHGAGFVGAQDLIYDSAYMSYSYEVN